MGAKRVDLVDGLFDNVTDEEPEERPEERPTKTPKPARLEAYLGLKRDPETGKIVPRPPPKKRTTVAASSFARTREQVAEMMRTGEWDGVAARHLVALYDIMHEYWYGFAPTLTGQERHRGVLLAGSFVKRLFAGDFEKALTYLRWLYTEEKNTEKWRRREGRSGTRIGLPLMFSGRKVDDWRVDLNRRKPR